MTYKEMTSTKTDNNLNSIDTEAQIMTSADEFVKW